MFELLTVVNLMVGAFMIGNDYESIVEYQNRHQITETVAESVEVDDEDIVFDLES